MPVAGIFYRTESEIIELYMVKLEIVGCYFGHGSETSVPVILAFVLKLAPELGHLRFKLV